MNQNKQMIMNYYQNEIFDYDKDFYNQYGIYVKPHGYSISSRKIESYIQIAEIQKYLQCNPVKAIDLFFNIELLEWAGTSCTKKLGLSKCTCSMYSWIW